MTQLNPFVNSVLQSGVVQRQQAAVKQAQIRRTQQLAKNVAAEDEQLESQVENTEELKPVRPEQDSDQRPHKDNEPPKDDDEKPRLDLTA